MEGYQQFTSSLQVPALAPAGNSSSLLVQQLQPTNLISQQYYYEYQQQQQPNCTDYLFAPPAPLSQNSPSIYYTDSNTQVIFNTNSFTTAVSTNNTYQQPQTVGFQPVETTTIVPESFDFESLLEDSSVFFSPQASSAESSASQSPESQSQFFAAAPAAAADSLDLSLDELLQNIGNSEENNIFGSSTGSVEDDLALSDELLEVLKDVEAGEDFFSELNFGDEDLLSPSGNISSPSSADLLNSSFSSSSSNSSVSSTPKRKYSSDSSSSSSSSTYCYSEASYQTAFNSSSSEPELEKATATKSTNKRARRAPKASPGEKAARKKDQNKRAACRYRSKKRTELQSSEMTMEELEEVRDSLAEQVKKLQTEFSVILPLAKAAFTFDPAKRGALAALLARVGDILA